MKEDFDSLLERIFFQVRLSFLTLKVYISSKISKWPSRKRGVPWLGPYPKSIPVRDHDGIDGPEFGLRILSEDHTK